MSLGPSGQVLAVFAESKESLTLAQVMDRLDDNDMQAWATDLGLLTKAHAVERVIQALCVTKSLRPVGLTRHCLWEPIVMPTPEARAQATVARQIERVAVLGDRTKEIVETDGPAAANARSRIMPRRQDRLAKPASTDCACDNGTNACLRDAGDLPKCWACFRAAERNRACIH